VTDLLVLDASVLIAAMSVGDAHHAEARGILREGARTQGLIAHTMTLAESAVGAVRTGREREIDIAFRVLGIRVSPSSDGESMRLARLRARTRLPLLDCCVLDAAIEAGAALATFDNRLGTAAYESGVSVVPTPRNKGPRRGLATEQQRG